MWARGGLWLGHRIGPIRNLPTKHSVILSFFIFVNFFPFRDSVEEIFEAKALFSILFIFILGDYMLCAS